MKRILSISMIGCLAVALAAGCEDKPAGTSTTGTSAAPAKEAKEAKEVVAQPAKITVNEFGSKVVDSACKVFSECKNEELRGLTEGTLLMVAAFGLMGPNMEPDPTLKALDEKMKADKRKFLDIDECKSVGTKLADKLGFSSAALAKLVSEKRVTFDEDKATACIAGLSKGPAACSDEVKLEGGEIKLSQLETFEKKYDGAMDAYTKVCEEVIKGTKKDGDTCEYDVECAEGSCKKDGKGDAMVCKPKKK